MTSLELGLFPLTQLKRPQEEQHLLHQKKQKMMTVVSYVRPPSSEDDDDSWEVKAFAEDTNNIMGTTWPPRFYACSFCRREFRSAQALGGHMNVHRRDRIRANNNKPKLPPVLITEALAGTPGGLCFIYPVAPGGPDQARPLPKISSSSTLFSMTSSSNNVGTISFGAAAEDFSLIKSCSDDRSARDDENGEEDLAVEEVDLELRLGW